jgi:hypothetical protein
MNVKNESTLDGREEMMTLCQGCGSGFRSQLDPDSIGSADPDLYSPPDPDPGGQKLPTKVKFKKFHVLKCWTFFFES